MIDDVTLVSALTEVYEAEAYRLEEKAAALPHVFSDRYIRKISRIAGMARRKYITVLGRRRRLILVAAVLIVVMIAAAVTTIAIVKPQIFYTIKENARSWSYSFRQKDPNNLTEKFDYKKPVPPEGYEIIEEYRDADIYSYTIQYEDKNGNFVSYNQASNLDDMGLSITNTAEKKDITVNGYEGTIYHEDDTYTILWDDGYYLYMINGNASKEELVAMAESI